MSDWQVGDLALAIGSPWCSVKKHMMPFKKGGVYTVASVGWKDDIYGNPVHCLGMEGIHGGILGMRSTLFLKITPPAADEFDRETIALMNRVGEPA